MQIADSAKVQAELPGLLDVQMVQNYFRTLDSRSGDLQKINSAAYTPQSAEAIQRLQGL